MSLSSAGLAEASSRSFLAARSQISWTISLRAVKSVLHRTSTMTPRVASLLR